MATITIPGLIDPHVHLRTPGQEEKEDFYTGTSAALAGGYTTVIDMPNNKIPITTLERLEKKIEIARKETVCFIGFYFGSLGDNLEEFEKVKDKVKGLKLYLNETTGNFLIDKQKLKDIFIAWNKTNADKPILLHAEDDAVEFVIHVVRQTKQKTHFCHISTSKDLQHIINAKEEGLPITCGITPHHLFLTKDDESKLGPFGKMKPPLQSREMVDFLWAHLNAIDVIESDHAPHTVTEKQADPTPYGVPGLETTLPLLLTKVHTGELKIDDIVRLCHDNPKNIFNVNLPSQTKVVIDFEKSWKISNNDLLTKCQWSPFNGWEIKGKVVSVEIGNTKVFEDGKILVEQGRGVII